MPKGLDGGDADAIGNWSHGDHYPGQQGSAGGRLGTKIIGSEKDGFVIAANRKVGAQTAWLNVNVTIPVPGSGPAVTYRYAVDKIHLRACRHEPEEFEGAKCKLVRGIRCRGQPHDARRNADLGWRREQRSLQALGSSAGAVVAAGLL